MAEKEATAKMTSCAADRTANFSGRIGRNRDEITTPRRVTARRQRGFGHPQLRQLRRPADRCGTGFRIPSRRVLRLRAAHAFPARFEKALPACPWPL